jgi:hypothetical protein
LMPKRPSHKTIAGWWWMSDNTEFPRKQRCSRSITKQRLIGY